MQKGMEMVLWMSSSTLLAVTGRLCIHPATEEVGGAREATWVFASLGEGEETTQGCDAMQETTDRTPPWLHIRTPETCDFRRPLQWPRARELRWSMVEAMEEWGRLRHASGVACKLRDRTGQAFRGRTASCRQRTSPEMGCKEEKGQK